MKRAALFALAISMAIGLVSGGLYGDVASDYETLFGAEAKKISLSASKTDDAEFAAKLLSLSKDMTDSPEAQVFFWRKAVDFGSTGLGGYQTALDAIALLEKAEPDKTDLWIDKKLVIAQGRYIKTPSSKKKVAAQAYIEAIDAAADAKLASGKTSDATLLYSRAIALAIRIGASDRAAAISAKRKTVGATAAKNAKLKAMHAKLAKDPGDFKAREQLIILYIVERDDPSEAKKLLSDDLDDALRTYVTLASKSVGSLKDVACLDLGDWYFKTLNKNASAAGKPIILKRAKSYYQRFLKLHKKPDMQKIRVKMSLQTIDAAIAKMDAPPPPKALSKFRTLDLGKGVRMKLVLIKPGKFMMGVPTQPQTESSSSSYNESPQHEVTISAPFYMGVTEVTQKQYATLTGTNPSKNKFPTLPVDTVSWVNATEFCKALSAKNKALAYLPTEAQWEYACRAGSTTIFSFGDEVKFFGSYGWARENSKRTSHPVGKKKANAFGLYDMHGNIREWCSDAYSSSFYRNSPSVDPENLPRVSPSTPKSDPSSSYRSCVLRGGSSGDTGAYSTSTRRNGYSSRYTSYRNGFRIVLLTEPRKAAASTKKPGRK
jgi:formylglycine-generating enzyme required for sulfatase activity